MAKAQAAMEFLMTYGWVIALVLLVIGTLNYFGVFSIQGLLPEKCKLGPGLVCVDYYLSNEGATLIVQNALGKEVTFTSVSLSLKSDPTPICAAQFRIPAVSGTRATLPCKGTIPVKGFNKETFIPTITFVMSDEEFSITGKLYARTQTADVAPAQMAFAYQAVMEKQQVACTPKAQAEDPSTMCKDGIDNDCDGSVDCADPDCKESSACTAALSSG